MFLVAEPLSSVRHSTDQRRRPSLPLFPGDDDAADDAANGRLIVGKPDVAEQTLHRALLPDRQMSRSRQGRALLH